MAMIEAGMNKQVIARKLKRTVMAVTSRLGKIRKRENGFNVSERRQAWPMN
ncbi:hypothetical protein [Bradyrhizobium sp.]|uniref:hypothetical protein n=1 Tax=Bradyrhizobium sp. TaxID=376 RepID=UPI003BB0BA90